MSKMYVNELLPKDAAGVHIPGNVVQVADNYRYADFTLSSSNTSTFAEVTSVSFTPKFATSKILIQTSLTFYIDTNNTVITTIFRDSTNIAPGGTRMAYNAHDTNNTHRDVMTVFYSESASSTSARTYKLMVSGTATTGITICPSASPSGILVMEIAQ